MKPVRMLLIILGSPFIFLTSRNSKDLDEFMISAIQGDNNRKSNSPHKLLVYETTRKPFYITKRAVLLPRKGGTNKDLVPLHIRLARVGSTDKSNVKLLLPLHTSEVSTRVYSTFASVLDRGLRLSSR